MKKNRIKIIGAIFMAAITFLNSSCANNSSNKGDQDTEYVSILPDYDKQKDGKTIFNSWYAPENTELAYNMYKDCGFDDIFLLGKNVGSIGDNKMLTALELCNKCGIKAYIDLGENINNCFDYTLYNNCPAFIGFNIDEPVLEYNTINKKQGIRQIAQYIENYQSLFPQKEFLINLNPFDCFYVFGNLGYDYNQYIEETYTSTLTKISQSPRWISVDSYPLRYNDTGKKKNYLLNTWLYQLDLMANFKSQHSEVKTNMFIQSLPYFPLHERKEIKREDIRMQVYVCMAFNFDMISYFCYQTPYVSGDSEKFGNGLIDIDGNKTAIYDYAKEINHEIKKYDYLYKQFSNWQGAYTSYGTNNTKKDEMYENDTMQLKNALASNRLGEIKAVSATEDILVTFSRDSNNNCGYFIVNYNETNNNLKNDVTLEFKNATYAIVIKNGEQNLVKLDHNKINIKLDVGDGAFVIPDCY